jgi:hypothetical protein
LVAAEVVVFTLGQSELVVVAVLEDSALERHCLLLLELNTRLRLEPVGMEQQEARKQVLVVATQYLAALRPLVVVVAAAITVVLD